MAPLRRKKQKAKKPFDDYDSDDPPADDVEMADPANETTAEYIKRALVRSFTKSPTGAVWGLSDLTTRRTLTANPHSRGVFSSFVWAEYCYVYCEYLL
ncbi:hypothetical protein CPLU01_15751 [Colletotrichum plurivorum]|uniref:Uncharacterized protein n=1 Tax=Colletotrichum plurivorum TaxID=2175906 RepID=A0A8H6J813_9PEZI|nr:hypothetical protein CPLU01_15751 [Colletotrichum plurivorum]